MSSQTISIYAAADAAGKALEAAYAEMAQAQRALDLPNPRVDADSVLHLLGNDPTYSERLESAFSAAIAAIDEMARAAAGRPTKADEQAVHEAEYERRMATATIDAE